MAKLLFVSSVSACIELDGNGAYYAENSYSVYVNEEIYGNIKKENVFSVFNLMPNTEYTVKAAGQIVKFVTEKESVCFDARKNGAVADGKTSDTVVLQSLINACPKNGRVTLPKGKYLTGPLWLKSDMTLELQKGARLIGLTDVSEYKPLPALIIDENGKENVFSTWEGEDFSSRESLINAYGVKNIKIVGEGVVDGNAQNSTWWTVEASERKIGRPRLFFINDCSSIIVHGIEGKNSASWTFHPFYSSKVSFYNVKVSSPKVSPNTDGINPEGCDGVNIIGCTFSSGDDCIAIKSGKRKMAEKFKRPAQNYVIRNCLMKFGHGAVVFGSEMSGGIKDIEVSKCFFYKTDRGLRIKTRRGRGKLAIVDGVIFENIVMDGVLTPLVINMYYNCDPIDGKSEYVWSRKPLPVGDDTPYLGDFTFKNIDCKNCECMAGYFDGLVEQPIKSIDIENVNFRFRKNAKPFWPASLSFSRQYCKEGLYFDNVKNIKIKNVTFTNVVGDAVILKNHESFKME